MYELPTEGLFTTNPFETPPSPFSSVVPLNGLICCTHEKEGMGAKHAPNYYALGDNRWLNYDININCGLCVVTPCSFEGGYRRFEEIFYLQC
jgi:hypothetical protein